MVEAAHTGIDVNDRRIAVYCLAVISFAGGDKGKVESAQKKITQSIVGLALVAASYALFQIVQYFLGIKILD